jgi:hypothetical protein
MSKIRTVLHRSRLERDARRRQRDIRRAIATAPSDSARRELEVIALRSDLY